MIINRSLLSRLHRTAGGPAALLLALSLASCGDEGGGLFQDVTIDPARERVNALEEDTDAAERTVASYFAALDQADGTRLGSLFTERAEVYLDGGRVLSAAEFVQEQEAAWAGRETTVTDVDLRGVSLVRPHGWAMARATIRGEGGSGPEVRQAVTFGLARRGDTWLIAHLHVSSTAGGSAPGA